MVVRLRIRRSNTFQNLQGLNSNRYLTVKTRWTNPVSARSRKWTKTTGKCSIQVKRVSRSKRLMMWFWMAIHDGTAVRSSRINLNGGSNHRGRFRITSHPKCKDKARINPSHLCQLHNRATAMKTFKIHLELLSKKWQIVRCKLKHLRSKFHISQHKFKTQTNPGFPCSSNKLDRIRLPSLLGYTMNSLKV